MTRHVQMLKAELERRKAKNRRYSLRAFARALNMDASALSRILSGKQDLSLSLCLKVLRNIELSEDQRGWFMASVAEDKTKKLMSALRQALSDGPKPPLDTN